MIERFITSNWFLVLMCVLLLILLFLSSKYDYSNDDKSLTLMAKKCDANIEIIKFRRMTYNGQINLLKDLDCYDYSRS